MKKELINISRKKQPLRNFGKGLVLQILLDKQMGAKNLDLGTVKIAPKGETGMHKRDFEEVIYMLSGSGQVVCESGETVILEKGDCVLIPPGILHKHVNHTAKALEQLYIFAPQAGQTIQESLRALPKI
jgi:quercetin dioxygenase-like cupin family protein